MVILNATDYIAHYGILRKSGRYPWNSGKGTSTQVGRNKTFLDFVDDMQRKGLSEKEIAEGQNITIQQLRSARSYARSDVKRDQIATAEKLKAKAMSNPAIAIKMKLSGESAVRALLADGEKEKAEILLNISNELKSQVDKKKFLDVGTGAETQFEFGKFPNKVSPDKLKVALFMLEEQGYSVHRLNQKSIGTGYYTKKRVLVPPGVTSRDVWVNRNAIQQMSTFTEDGGRHFSKSHPIVSIDQKRVKVIYKEDGGDKADGLIELRPGLTDLSMGNNTYAQVRIKIGKDNFLKGMAVYNPDLPKGVDIAFHTPKSKKDFPEKLSVMKTLSKDPDFPFESLVRPLILNLGHPTKEEVKSAINIVNDDNDWSKWSNTISSQVLSKQKPTFVKEQLDKTYDISKAEFDDIMSLNNPAVRKKLLNSFADGADSSAAHLKAAKLPRQSWKAILPLKTLKNNEIYAPDYNDGEIVVLIRYPHGGLFEIPTLRVNNKNREGKKFLGDAKKAVGINSSTAVRLSGADFDGDTVLVIPNARGKIQTRDALPGLKNFDPMSYKLPDGAPQMLKKTHGIEMGKISNLITDMTIRGGTSEDQLTRAIKHSMVVVDSFKKNLDYRRSYKDHGIKALQSFYQNPYTKSGKAGASTLISIKRQFDLVPQLKSQGTNKFPQGAPVDKKTGKKIQELTNRTRVNKDGSVSLVKEKYQKLSLVDDVNVYSSGTRIESLYANYSNRQKALANRARLEAINSPPIKMSASAKKIYQPEIDTLRAKLYIVKKNRTLERHAQTIAQASIQARKDANPNLDKDDIKKISFQELAKARTRTKAAQGAIIITDKEWVAIQAGAISNSMLNDILAKADMKVVREHAAPRRKILMTPRNTLRAQALRNQGYTRAEIAKKLGVSISTLDASLT